MEIIQLCLIVIVLIYALLVFVRDRMPGSTTCLIAGCLILVGSAFHAVGTSGQSETARVIGLFVNCSGMLVFCAGVTRYWFHHRDLRERAEQVEQRANRIKERCLNGT